LDRVLLSWVILPGSSRKSTWPPKTLEERDRFGDADPAPELRPDQYGCESITVNPQNPDS
jgi:hypothetical protein